MKEQSWLFSLVLFISVLSVLGQDSSDKLTPYELKEGDGNGSKISLLERNASLFENLYWSGTNTTLYINSKKNATFSGWVKAYYKNELTTKLRKLSYYIKGRPVETITFKPNGDRCTETTLREGNGKETHWHPNGIKREISAFQNGLANGDYKMWYANGNLEEDGSIKALNHYEMGKLLSSKPPWSSFHFSSIEEEAFWNKLDEWEINDEAKRRNNRGEVIDSNGTDAFTGYIKERRFRKKGDTISGVRIISNYKNGFLERCKSWYQSGKENFDFKYKYGQREGLSVAWYENGQKKAEQNFKDGEFDGVAYEWHENGVKKSEVNFKAGKRHGVALAWHENGQNKDKQNFKDGEMIYHITSWFENGQKRAGIFWEQGVPIARIWDENGDLAEEINLRSKKTQSKKSE
jgi:antitoxin component YwqK of YwqJK toxin-antitoxin module